MSSWREAGGRENPWARLSGIIGERPASEVDGVRAKVSEFDPVIEGFGIGDWSARIGSHELGDND